MAPLRRSDHGACTAVIGWRHYADPEVAPLRRSWNGSIGAVSDTAQADAGFEKFRKPTRRDAFLAEMDQLVPWAKLCALIELCYPRRKAGAAGRLPVGIQRMLRIHFLQQWFTLSDPAVEESLYDSEAMRRFVGIDLGRERVPDETTVCKFRHLLERNGIAEQIFAAINLHLREKGLTLSKGTIVDATIIRTHLHQESRWQA